MNKLIASCAIAFMLVVSAPTTIQGTVVARETRTPDPHPFPSPEAEIILLRLDEINAMDKTGMNAVDKKELRTEVKALKKELKKIHGGVYLSSGAIIVIIILLIILL